MEIKRQQQRIKQAQLAAAAAAAAAAMSSTGLEAQSNNTSNAGTASQIGKSSGSSRPASKSADELLADSSGNAGLASIQFADWFTWCQRCKVSCSTRYP